MTKTLSIVVEVFAVCLAIFLATSISVCVVF